MRISDWSSDVCSSDLLGNFAERGRLVGGHDGLLGHRPHYSTGLRATLSDIPVVTAAPGRYIGATSRARSKLFELCVSPPTDSRLPPVAATGAAVSGLMLPEASVAARLRPFSPAPAN